MVWLYKMSLRGLTKFSTQKTNKQKIFFLFVTYMTVLLSQRDFSSEFSGGVKKEQFESRSLLLNKALLNHSDNKLLLSHGLVQAFSVKLVQWIVIILSIIYNSSKWKANWWLWENSSYVESQRHNHFILAIFISTSILMEKYSKMPFKQNKQINIRTNYIKLNVFSKISGYLTQFLNSVHQDVCETIAFVQ